MDINKEGVICDTTLNNEEGVVSNDTLNNEEGVVSNDTLNNEEGVICNTTSNNEPSAPIVEQKCVRISIDDLNFDMKLQLLNKNINNPNLYTLIYKSISISDFINNNVSITSHLKAIEYHIYEAYYNMCKHFYNKKKL